MGTTDKINYSLTERNDQNEHYFQRSWLLLDHHYFQRSLVLLGQSTIFIEVWFFLTFNYFYRSLVLLCMEAPTGPTIQSFPTPTPYQNGFSSIRFGDLQKKGFFTVENVIHKHDYVDYLILQMLCMLPYAFSWHSPI